MKYLSIVSPAVQLRTEGQTDITNVIVAFRNFLQTRLKIYQYYNNLSVLLEIIDEYSSSITRQETRFAPQFYVLMNLYVRACLSYTLRTD